MRILFSKREHDVLERIRSGDNKAMEQIYNEYRNEFIGWSVENHSISEQDALDHYQDTITIFFEKVMNGTLQEIESSVKTYLFGIGKNRILQQFQKENTRQRHEEDVSEHYRFLAEKEINEIYTKASQTASGMFSLLGDKCQEILKLFYFDKRSMTEIASLMNFKNEGVARTSKKRCLEKIRQEMEKGKVNGG